jgi:hypothetical protein
MPILIALLVISLLMPIDACAQSLRGNPQLSPQEIEAARASCDELDRMPNAPMSAAACKAMLNMGARLEAAAADPTVTCVRCHPNPTSMPVDAYIGYARSPIVASSFCRHHRSSLEALGAHPVEQP